MGSNGVISVCHVTKYLFHAEQPLHSLDIFDIKPHKNIKINLRIQKFITELITENVYSSLLINELRFLYFGIVK